MGSLAAHREALIDMRTQWRSIREAAKHGPLQTLTERELEVRDQPLTVYPRNAQIQVKAWCVSGLRRSASIRGPSAPHPRSRDRVPLRRREAPLLGMG